MDLLYLTAQRISDVLALRVSDITDAGIRFEQEKTGARALVAMTPELQGVISGARSVRGMMFRATFSIPEASQRPTATKRRVMRSSAHARKPGCAGCNGS